MTLKQANLYKFLLKVNNSTWWTSLAHSYSWSNILQLVISYTTSDLIYWINAPIALIKNFNCCSINRIWNNCTSYTEIFSVALKLFTLYTDKSNPIWSLYNLSSCVCNITDIIIYRQYRCYTTDWTKVIIRASDWNWHSFNRTIKYFSRNLTRSWLT